MKKVIIVHGYTGHPDKNWFPWLKSKLENNGVNVIVPEMPDSRHPNLSKWLSHLQSVITNPDEDTYLIGHSLGCITILRYIEALAESKKVGGILLVAGFISPIHIHQLDEFTIIPIDKNKIIERVASIVAINSDNDPHVPYLKAIEIQNCLKAELIPVHEGGHLNEKAGYKEFPLVLNEIAKMIGIDPENLI